MHGAPRRPRPWILIKDSESALRCADLARSTPFVGRRHGLYVVQLGYGPKRGRPRHATHPGGKLTLNELSQVPVPSLSWPDDALPGFSETEQAPAVVLPADGRFGAHFDGYVVIPEPLLAGVVERTEAEPAAFGSYAAMGPFGSFELRRSDIPASTALITWPGVTMFYYARERHLAPILTEMGIPIIPLKRDFLMAYERVITELGQI